MRERGVWALAWSRFRRDRIGFASLIVVLSYVAIMAAAAAGWLAGDWSDERGVSYAPPTFIGPDLSAAAAVTSEQRGPVDDYGISDPLAVDLVDIAKGLSGIVASTARAPTLAFGGDKWGRDVVKKTL